MNKNTDNKEKNMTDKQSLMLLEAIKIIAKKSETIEEVIEAIEKIEEKGLKKPE